MTFSGETFSCTFPCCIQYQSWPRNSATSRTFLSAGVHGTRSGLGQDIWIWGGRSLAGIRHQKARDPTLGERKECNKAWPSGNCLVCDLLESVEVWPASSVPAGTMCCFSNTSDHSSCFSLMPLPQKTLCEHLEQNRAPCSGKLLHL